MKEASKHQQNVRRVLEGNERVWFHPHDDLIAVWHGGPQIQIVNSRTFDDVDVMNVRATGRTKTEIENAVSFKLTRLGFDRCGRTQDNTRIVSH